MKNESCLLGTLDEEVSIGATVFRDVSSLFSSFLPSALPSYLAIVSLLFSSLSVSHFYALGK